MKPRAILQKILMSNNAKGGRKREIRGNVVKRGRGKGEKGDEYIVNGRRRTPTTTPRWKFWRVTGEINGSVSS